MPPSPEKDYEQYNLSGVVSKSLYLGFMINFLLPGIFLFVCYYLDVNYKYTNPPFTGEMVDTIFIATAVVTLILAAIALFLKQKLYTTRLVENAGVMGTELAENLAVKMRPIFILIMLISLLGVFHYYLTAQFKQTFFFILISFVIFQFVRPRYGFVKKLIDSQLKLLGNNKQQ